MIRILTASAVALTFAAFTPAHAQSDFWAGVTADAIGQAMSNSSSGPYVNVRCMTGRSAVSPRQTERIRSRATEAMASYVARAQTGESVDVTDSFVGSQKEGAWRLNGVFVEPALVSDPLAPQIGPSPLSEPDHFIAGGNRNSASAIWFVRDASGQVAGHYRGVFTRSRNRWSLSLLDVVEGADEPAALAPFCQFPGDVEQFLATHDERGRLRPVDAPPADAALRPPTAEATEEAKPAPEATPATE